MQTIEIARKLAEYRKVKEAQKAYTLALLEIKDNPKFELEAASYIFFSNGDYKTSYKTFVSLYNRGYFKAEIMNIMLQAFYEPNVKKQKKLYEKNCKVLSSYPYLFQKNFVEFDNLPILFFPYDNDGFIPYNVAEDRFESYVNFNDNIINRYFFKDLENPILADDVYSQYQLEYLNDNVRKSEWVARENHIYLNYTNWSVFCAYLQCIDWKAILNDQKFVFLIEDEIKQYPIDFKERFGIDYSKYTVKPIGIREVNKLIWHTQLAAHNGGDFFNEIFYGHPNLVAFESVMFSKIKFDVDDTMEFIKDSKRKGLKLIIEEDKAINLDREVLNEVISLNKITKKDIFVAMFLGSKQLRKNIDFSSRIVPVIFFQPHFYNVNYNISYLGNENAMLKSKQYDEIKKSHIFKGFKYIKTFTPIRRPSTSYAASVKFALSMINEEIIGVEKDEKTADYLKDIISSKICNKSFMSDPSDRLYRDSTMVRFEDGKLNPTATFTALAEFLDIPYTQSMTYCSGTKGVNPESLPGNARGFDPVTVYRTYDEFANFDERYFLEYFMRDAYEYYGYDFNYYDGAEMTEEKIQELVTKFTTLDGYVEQTMRKSLTDEFKDNTDMDEQEKNQVIEEKIKDKLEEYHKKRIQMAQVLNQDIHFINKKGQIFNMIPLLKLDPELLEQPLYH